MSDLPRECAWAREAASARLDDELAEVEGLRLDRHLRACLGCFAHVSAVGGIAIAIRGGELEQPASRIFTPGIPRRRRRVGAVVTGAALAVAVAVGVASFGLAQLRHGSRSPVPAAIAAGDAPSTRADATQQHLLVQLGDAVSSPQGRMEAV
jgi:predicted anti-sigma-YlaC factor YlaD